MVNDDGVAVLKRLEEENKGPLEVLTPEVGPAARFWGGNSGWWRQGGEQRRLAAPIGSCGTAGWGKGSLEVVMPLRWRQPGDSCEFLPGTKAAHQATRPHSPHTLLRNTRCARRCSRTSSAA